MARRRALIAIAMALPASVAFKFSPPPTPPPPDPQPVALTQPVAATTPAAPAPVLPPVLPSALPASPAGIPRPDRDVGSIVVDAALTRVGAPYEWAATGPDAFDCSGLVVWAFRQAGITLPHSSEALAAGGEPVDPQQMQPGDVISLFPDASHVGIYVGDGRLIHAQFEGLPVIVESLSRAPINNVRRYR